MAFAFSSSEDPSTALPRGAPVATGDSPGLEDSYSKTKSIQSVKGAPIAVGDTPGFEDSYSETSTVESDLNDTGASPNLANLTFFTRLYELPLVNDAVSSIYQIAESNRYTSAIISYAEKVGGLAEKSLPLLKPVERPIAALDGYATRSLDIIESKYPILAKPTSEVIESVQSHAKAVETKYPVIARTFAVAKSTANSALDHVDYLVDYVLPARAGSNSSTPAAEDSQTEGEQQQQQQPDATSTATDSPLGKVTIIVRKVPQRLGGIYYEQLENSRLAVDGVKQSIKDTATVYTAEVSERSSKLLESVQERVKNSVNTTIPGILPQFAQPYYEHGKEVVVTKATKLHAEYSRTDEDVRSKVFNLILISGEHVPVLDRITSRVFDKATGAASPATPVSAGSE
ncbi:hypothetical protein IWW38_000221 [Coemansia aciculifera]|uniref:Uncharacterized protein n=1 Tax=Coemansia aciculifera TaxID=417176 RepID=A0ACC1MBF5_9FUNG|nr:hypothetical protein IWW38_000221 [Coemansia aciculifera]